MKTLPWLTAIAALGLAAWLWFGGPPAPDAPAMPVAPPCPPPEVRVETETRFLPSADQLSELRQCNRGRREAEEALQRCRRPRLDLAPQLEAGGASVCLGLPEVQNAFKRHLANELERHVKDRAHAQTQKRAEREVQVTTWLEKSLDLRPEQGVWLGQYVCAVRDMRALAGEKSYTFKELTYERQRMFKDLEAYLGQQRYKRLREAGGIGLLADVLQCD
jgi:hypothetical protein